jgi:transcriptional regulator MraZ
LALASDRELVILAAGLEGSARKAVDDKDRVALLSGHVARLTNEVVLVPGAAPCIEIHPLESWRRYRKRLTEAADRGPAEANFARHVLGNAQRARLDGQGRVRIEDELLRWAGIPVRPGDGPREVLAMGMGSRVELWLPERWASQRSQYETSFETIRAALFEGGTSQAVESDEDDE